MRVFTKITIVAIIAITILEGIALIMGINGAGLAVAVAIIAGLGGYKIARRENEKDDIKNN